MSLALHPRLSLSAIVTPSWTFAQDLRLWTSTGLQQVGLLQAKVSAHGVDRVADALQTAGLAAGITYTG